MEDIPHFDKTPWDEWPITMDFAEVLSEDVTLESCTVVATDQQSGEDVSEDVFVDPEATIDDGVAAVEVTGGTLGHIYTLSFQGTLSNGQQHSGAVIMSVQPVAA